MDKEAFYDKEIAPLILEAGKKCEANGLALVAMVEWAPDEAGRTVALPAGASLHMQMMNVLASVRSGGTFNFDSFMISLERRLGPGDHGSMYLSQLNHYRRMMRSK